LYKPRPSSRPLDGRKFQHSLCNIETNDGPGFCGGEKRQVSSAGCQIQHTRLGAQRGLADQPALPPSILAVRQDNCNEIVAIGDAVEEPADVSTFACRRRKGLFE
jgi:hypothetical protein